MLTKTDLNQIGQVIDQKLEPIKKELSQVGQLIDEKLDQKLEPIKKDLKSLKKDVGYLKKTANVIVASFDEADVKLEKRVRKIEHHLALPEEN